MKKTIILCLLLVVSLCNSEQQNHHACAFCNIINRTAPAKIIAENNDVIVFKSHSGHPLIVPKKHISDLRQVQPQDKDIWLKLVQAAQALSANSERPGDFQFHVNTGPQAGQTVFHLHVHYISRSKLLSETIQI